jgi:uncharacterized lipoprotein YehR (DUF1307 family)
MKSLYSYFFLFSILNLQIEGRYERHNQFCGDINGTDIRWSLDIKENKTYVLEITARKNEYLSKPKTTFISGTWQEEADTIKLSHWAKKDNVLIFYKKNDRLMFQSSKSKFQSRDLIYLDYLEKPMD